MRFITSILFFSAIWLARCTSGEVNTAQSGDQTAAGPADGMAIFKKNCIQCHGADGKLGLNGAKDLTQSALTPEERILVITNGRNLMTPFKGVLTEAEIKAVAAYTTSLAK